MLLFKFRIVLSLLFLSHSMSLMALSSQSSLKFSLNECLDKTYTSEVTHKGQPFGLTDTTLRLEKEGCVLKIHHQSLKYLKKSWVVDVCRAPVHIKSGAGAVTVLRREGACTENLPSEFCLEAQEIKSIFQDDGLIFAEGEREDLNSAHGQIHCGYTLLQHYLDEGKVLSRHDNLEFASGVPTLSTQEDLIEEFPESSEPGKF